jgi:branched-chain amino acid transport system substrate-binding protein
LAKLKLFFYFLLVSCFLFIFSSCSLDKHVVDDEYFNVGVIVSLTGIQASFELGVLDVYNFTISEINSNGGINGKKINLIVLDGQCIENVAKAATKDLVFKYDLDVIIGGSCSSAALGIINITEPNEVLFISSTSSSHDISDLGDFVFRNIFSNSELSEKLAEEIFFNGLRKVAVVTDDSVYANSYKDTFIFAFEELGGNIEYSYSYNLDNDSDNLFFNDLLNSGSEALVYFNRGELSASWFFSELKEYEYNFSIFGGELLITDLMVTKFPEIVDGVKFVTVDVDLNKDSVKTLFNDINYFAGLDLTLNIPPVYIVSSYDLFYILKKVIEENNCNFNDTVCMKNGLYYMESFNSILGNISFDLEGDINFFPSIYLVNGSELILLD